MINNNNSNNENMVNGDKDNPASISNSSESNNLAASSCVLPWTLLEGEDLVNQDTCIKIKLYVIIIAIKQSF